MTMVESGFGKSFVVCRKFASIYKLLHIIKYRLNDAGSISTSVKLAFNLQINLQQQQQKTWAQGHEDARHLKFWLYKVYILDIIECLQTHE